MLALLEVAPVRRRGDPLRTLGTIRELAHQAYSLTATFLSLRRIDALEPRELRTLDLAEVLDEACSQADVWAQVHRVSVDYRLDTRPLVRGEHDLLMRVFLNVLNNAIKASPPGATVHVSIDRHGNRVRIHIEDRGVGLKPRKAATSKSHRAYPQGLGQGLAFVRRVVRAHFGAFTLAPREGGGAIATIDLPLEQPTATASTAVSTSSMV